MLLGVAQSRGCRDLDRPARHRDAHQPVPGPLRLGAERRGRCALVRRARWALGDRVVEPPRQFGGRPGPRRACLARHRDGWELHARRRRLPARSDARRHQHVSRAHSSRRGRPAGPARGRRWRSGLRVHSRARGTPSVTAPRRASRLPARPPPCPRLLASRRLNVSARLEADADADGYGDETQDACPGSAGASSGCPSGSTPSEGRDAPDRKAAVPPGLDPRRPRRTLGDRQRGGQSDRAWQGEDLLAFTARTACGPPPRTPPPTAASGCRCGWPRTPNVPHAARCVAGNACARGSP